MINKYILKNITGALYSINENGWFINIKYLFSDAVAMYIENAAYDMHALILWFFM